jgi:hypothetical protein
VAEECDRCGGFFRWESVSHFDEDSWIGICECGMTRSFIPDGPESSDPLRAALLGDHELQCQSPPWIRLHRASMSYGVRWQYAHSLCGGCRQRPVFETKRNPHPMVDAHARLCLNCGWVSIRNVSRRGAKIGRWLQGDQWTPPCIAVKHLRNCVFRDARTEMARAMFRNLSSVDDGC